MLSSPNLWDVFMLMLIKRIDMIIMIRHWADASEYEYRYDNYDKALARCK